MNAIGRFFYEARGSIAILSALMLPVVLGAVGVSIDYGRAYLVQQRLSQALDAAVLAATASSMDEEVIEQKISDFLAANYPPEKIGVAFTPEVEFEGHNIIVTGHAEYETSFVSVLGIDSIDVVASNQVTRTVGTNIELALVLDISASMQGQKLTDLKEAAALLVDTVVYDDQEDYYSKIAIVPYSMAVNVGSYAADVRGPITAAKTITAATKANPVVVTSTAHGFSNGDKVYITGVSGMTQINNKVFTVAGKTANTFQLSGIDGRSYSTFRNTASLYCTNPGCQYQYFQSPSGNWNIFQVSTCVTERTGANKYTDVAPSTAYVGRNYPAGSNTCLSTQILPLTSDKDDLNDRIDDLVASGSTGGQVGVGWGWYLLSPEFGYLWPAGSAPAAYGTEELHKIMVLMTDGEYNSPYCNGVIAKDATTGSGNTSDHINCNASNGNSYTQAEEMCDAMKAEGKNIEIYTIGFHVDAYPRGEQLMEYCATDEDHFYTADDGDELKRVFEAIANNVTELYLSR